MKSGLFCWPSHNFREVVGTSPHWAKTGERILMGEVVPDLKQLAELSDAALKRHGIEIGGSYEKPGDAPEEIARRPYAMRMAEGDWHPRRAAYTLAEATHADVAKEIDRLAALIAHTHGPGRIYTVGGKYGHFGYVAAKTTPDNVADVRRMCVEAKCKDNCENGYEHVFDSEPRILIAGYYIHITNNEQVR